jgi:DNA mismatch repair protein MLH3
MPFHGTIVSITNLFGSLPVRRKYVSSLSWPAQVKAIKLALFPVALARPNISISVYDMKDSKVFAISGNKPGGPTDIMREVQVLRASCGMDIMASWDVVHARLDQFGVKGVIGLHPVSVKAAQHIRKRIHVDWRALWRVVVNGRRWAVGNLYQDVNGLFLSSSFLSDKGKAISSQVARPQISKQFNKYPAFVLSISCPLEIDDLTQDKSKSLVATEVSKLQWVTKNFDWLQEWEDYPWTGSCGCK